MAKMNDPKRMSSASSSSCFFVVGVVGIVYVIDVVDVCLTKIVSLPDST